MNVWGCPNLLSTQEFDRAAKENSEEDPEEAASQEPELDPRERAKQKVLELESPWIFAEKGGFSCSRYILLNDKPYKGHGCSPNL
jgi:hypothetical protein